MAELRAAAADLEGADGRSSSTLDVFQRFAAFMATRLARHAAKEDELLFPALEEAAGGFFPPTVVMRSEHGQIHAGGDLLRARLAELSEVDHPAILLAEEQLRDLSAGGAAPAQLATVARDILALIESHFAKEEQVLFPAARQMLDRATLDRLGEAMSAFGAATP